MLCDSAPCQYFFIFAFSKLGTKKMQELLCLVTVLELEGCTFAASLAGGHLRDLGASVSYFPSGCVPDCLCRGKTRVGWEEAMRMSADVVIDGRGEAVLDREGVVYVRVCSFSSDEEASDVDEEVALAKMGAFRGSLNRQLQGVGGSFMPFRLASAYASVHAAFAAVSSMYHARRGGKADSSEVRLVDALSDTLVHNSLQFACPSRYLNPRQRAVTRATAVTTAPLTRSQVQELLDPFYAHYTCKGGGVFYLVAPSHASHQKRVLEVLGVKEEVLGKVPIADPYTGKESGIGGSQVGDEWRAPLRRLFGSRFATLTAKEWEAKMAEAGVPCAAHRSTEEWTRSDHVRKAGLIRKGAPCEIAWFEYGRRVGGEEPLAGEAWFSGVRVLDLSNVIAGPTIGAMLARHGADVIKVDPPSPVYSPAVTVVWGVAANAGKRSVLLDVHEDREELDKLIAGADVVIVNCTEGSLSRMRLTATDVARVNPRAVLARFDAWSGPCGEGEKPHVGYDDCVQAATGMMLSYGGEDAPEEVAFVGTIDVVSGVAGAMAVAAALYSRARTGVVHAARSSLCACANRLLFPARKAAYPATGEGCRGVHPLLCCYMASDDWMLVARREEATEEEMLALLDFDFRCKTVSEWEDVLLTWGVKVCRLGHLADGDRVTDRGHPLGQVTMSAPVAVRIRGREVPCLRAPKYGAHTADLTSLGHRQWCADYLPEVVL